MDTTRTTAALFNFDGVVMDTETQYTVFWGEQRHKYLNEEDSGCHIKGQTLTRIYEKYFSDLPETQQEITTGLNAYEKSMPYEYIPGVEAFIANLRKHGAKIAVVTSSDEEKVQNVYNTHPEFKEIVDRTLIGKMFACSRPAPDCFLLNVEIFSITSESSYVLEDSFHGLQAGVTSGATIIGPAATNTGEAVTGKAHYIIDGFSEMISEHLLALHR